MFNELLGICFWREGFEAALGPERGERGLMDMDGDQDVYTVIGDAFEGDVYQNIFFENSIGNENNWFNIQLKGNASNRCAIGAKIVLTLNDHKQSRKLYHTVELGVSYGVIASFLKSD